MRFIGAAETSNETLQYNVAIVETQRLPDRVGRVQGGHFRPGALRYCDMLEIDVDIRRPELAPHHDRLAGFEWIGIVAIGHVCPAPLIILHKKHAPVWIEIRHRARELDRVRLSSLLRRAEIPELLDRPNGPPLCCKTGSPAGDEREQAKCSRHPSNQRPCKAVAGLGSRHGKGTL